MGIAILILIMIGLIGTLLTYGPWFPEPIPESKPDWVQKLYDSFPNEAKDQDLEEFRRELGMALGSPQKAYNDAFHVMLDRQLHYWSVGLKHKTVSDVKEGLREKYKGGNQE